MALTQEQVFDRSFDIRPFPEPPRGVAITDRVHESAIGLAESVGLLPIDLRGDEAAKALQLLEKYRVSTVLGRGDFDKAMKGHPDGAAAFWKMRNREMELAVRLGNGVAMDTQRAFDDGITVLRTPRGNAESVRIWQDLLMLAAYFGESNREFAAFKNPAFVENEEVKSVNTVKPQNWDRREVSGVVNPEDPAAARCTEVLRGKKVAVIGGGGIIGREVIANSVFLKDANVCVFDPGLNGANGEDFKVAATLEDALQDAEVVVLHQAGDKEILGAKELALLKKGAKVFNVARGGCVNPRALFEAIESGQVSGAGLDVHVAEKGEVAKFLDVPEDAQERQSGHWAVLLRNHPRVIATNHSAASEAQAEEINARDAVLAVHRYVTRGEINNALALARIGFPYDGFVQGRDDGGFSPQNFKGPRLAMEVFHDGGTPGLIARMRRSLRTVVGGDLQVVDSTLRNKPVGDRLNGVEFTALDLPEAVWGQVDEKMLAELVRQAEVVRGVHRVKFFCVDRKKVA